VNFSYAIEQAAAQTVFTCPARERRLLLAAFSDIARSPLAKHDMSERDSHGRELFTRFFGPFSVSFWIDHAVAEVRIVLVYRD
jgi:hypothetical protein